MTFTTLLYRYDQQSLSIDFLELLEPFIPSDFETKLLVNYEKDGRPLEELTDEDQFILRFGKIPRLKQRITLSLSWATSQILSNACSRSVCQMHYNLGLKETEM